MSTVDWILVADRSRARLLHAVPDAKPPFVTLSSFVHADSRLSRQDRESDAPGRLEMFTGAHTSVEPRIDEAHATAQKFARELIDYLEPACRDNRFDRLFVVAPPLFLGVLRDAWTPRLKRAVAGEFDKDLAAYPDADLHRRLTELLASA